MNGEVIFSEESKTYKTYCFSDAKRIKVRGRVVVAQLDKGNPEYPPGTDVETEIWPDEEGEKGADDIRGIKQEMASLRTEIASSREVLARGIREVEGRLSALEKDAKDLLAGHNAHLGCMGLHNWDRENVRESAVRFDGTLTYKGEACEIIGRHAGGYVIHVPGATLPNALYEWVNPCDITLTKECDIIDGKGTATDKEKDSILEQWDASNKRCREPRPGETILALVTGAKYRMIGYDWHFGQKCFVARRCGNGEPHYTCFKRNEFYID